MYSAVCTEPTEVTVAAFTNLKKVVSKEFFPRVVKEKVGAVSPVAVQVRVKVSPTSGPELEEVKDVMEPIFMVNSPEVTVPP